ncbi:MAG TPA: hypothetical protein VFO16_23955, partial [Pseudonocardiaceae bacterium]|nr:hypothetical protein [Pseudonocardiaceae bacterium]
SCHPSARKTAGRKMYQDAEQTALVGGGRSSPSTDVDDLWVCRFSGIDVGAGTVRDHGHESFL